MKNLVLTCFAVILTACTTLAVNCNNDRCSCCDAYGNKYTPDYSNCSVFFHQYNGESVQRECSAGLVFDINACVCNWPEVSAQCECSSGVTSETVETTAVTSATEPSQNNSVTANSTLLQEVEAAADEGVEAIALGPEVVDKCTCQEKGNYYSVLPNSNCKKFSQRTDSLTLGIVNCPAGLIFDVQKCVCNWNWAAICPDQCDNGAYVGCYTDKARRALPHLAYVSKNQNSPAKCIATCKAAGYTYAGVQYRRECFCGNSVGFSLVSDDQCNMPCTDGQGEMCGGYWRNSVYRTD